MGLPPQHRLRGHRVFDRLYRQGRRVHGELMVLRVLAADASL
jgi:ribonuclease P protein component